MLALLLQIVATEPLAAPTRELRDAQARFESVRRMHLSVLRSPPARCDARIGRFCYWYDSTPPPAAAEAPAVREAREAFLTLLDSAGRGLPADPWIAGQRVRYLLDAKRPGEAASLPCAAERWWCSALRGLALHVLQRHPAADSAFTAALDAMPPTQRCGWTDITALLEDRLARELRSAPCGEREVLADRAWRLAQPLWLTGGNDARSEHLARRTMDVLLNGTANPHGSGWAADTRELLLRYGWSETFTRSPSEPLAAYSWSVLGHDREPNWNVMTRVASLRRPWVPPDAWDLRSPLARSRYAPRHLTALLELPHQLARVPAGDSLLLAVAVLPGEGALAGDSVTSAVLLAVPGEPRGTPFPGRTVMLTVPSDTAVVSIEQFDWGTSRAARARYSIAPLPCHAWCLSDLLLFEPLPGRDSLPLREVLERSIPARVRRDQPLGVWWHVRGAAGAPVSLALTLEPARAGTVRRAAEWLRLTRSRSRSAVRLRWQAVQRDDSASTRLVVRLPERANGRYRLTVTARTRAGTAVTASRELDVVP